MVEGVQQGPVLVGTFFSIGLVLHPPGLRLLICLFTISLFYRHEANVIFPR